MMDAQLHASVAIALLYDPSLIKMRVFFNRPPYIHEPSPSTSKVRHKLLFGRE
jgi:hypothetical protein